MIKRLLAFSLALASTALASTLGCGSGGPYEYVKVSGRISYDDGTPIPAGVRLLFQALDAPQVAGANPRPGRAVTDSQGNFECVTSYKYCDGLIPGRHKVAIQEAVGNDGRLLVPKDYTDITATPLMVSTDDAPLEIKVPKPAADGR